MNKKFAIKINKISKSFDEKVVLSDISFSLYFAQKVGLVGANGSGKSTLAKIISGIEKPSKGTIEIFKNFTTSYLPQEFTDDILVSEYFKSGGSSISLILKTLSQFSFNGNILDRRILSLSGGEKTKIFLSKIEMEQSQIIILDEPTNNLDGEGIDYLERIIKKSKSAFLIISHDRKFLDNTVTKVIELSEYTRNIKTYDGNYSDYKIGKENYEQRENMLYAENQRKKGKITKEILRHDVKSSRNLKMTVIKTDNNKMAAKKRIELLERSAGKNLKRAQVKLENLEERESTIIKRPLKIDFSEMKKSGNDVLKIKNLKLKYGHADVINSEINISDRVLISGRNGAGKTTLVQEILNRYNTDGNKVDENVIWGENVNIGYLPQDLSFTDKTKVFLDYFLEQSNKEITDARKILNRFSFTDDEVKSNIADLSPGMRGRGKIAIMLANSPNVLVLDEPTNNLDLEVLEEFEKALEKYEGTIIFVSHDRYFIEKIKPNKTIAL